MKKRYHLQDVFRVEDLEKIFKQQVKKDSTVLIYKGKNPYSGLDTINVEEEFKVELDPLNFPAFAKRLRSRKRLLV